MAVFEDREKYQAYDTKISERLLGCYRAKIMCDIVFRVTGDDEQTQDIWAHSVVLSSISRRLRAHFENEDFSHLKPLEVLKACNVDVFSTFVEFAYTDEANITQLNAFALCKLAQDYDVCSLEEVCEDFIRRCLDDDEQDKLELLVEAIKHEDHRAIDIANRFLKSSKQIQEKIMEFDQIEMITFDLIKRIVKSNHLKLAEEDVWRLCLAWKGDQYERHDKLKELIQHVRFRFVDIDFVNTEVRSSDLFSLEQLIDIITMKANGQISDEKRREFPALRLTPRNQSGDVMDDFGDSKWKRFEDVNPERAPARDYSPRDDVEEKTPDAPLQSPDIDDMLRNVDAPDLRPNISFEQPFIGGDDLNLYNNLRGSSREQASNLDGIGQDEDDSVGEPEASGDIDERNLPDLVKELSADITLSPPVAFADVGPSQSGDDNETDGDYGVDEEVNSLRIRSDARVEQETESKLQEDGLVLRMEELQEPSEIPRRNEIIPITCSQCHMSWAPRQIAECEDIRHGKDEEPLFCKPCAEQRFLDGRCPQHHIAYRRPKSESEDDVGDDLDFRSAMGAPFGIRQDERQEQEHEEVQPKLRCDQCRMEFDKNDPRAPQPCSHEDHYVSGGTIPSWCTKCFKARGIQAEDPQGLVFYLCSSHHIRQGDEHRKNHRQRSGKVCNGCDQTIGSSESWGRCRHPSHGSAEIWFHSECLEMGRTWRNACKSHPFSV